MDEHPGLREVLDLLGWDQPKRDSWVTVRCGHHEDRQASARCSVELGAYRCLACDLSAGSPAGLLMKAKGMTFKEANNRLRDLGVDDRREDSRMWKHDRKRQAFRQPWHRGRAARS